MTKTVGIIGGMGPLATCDLMRKIIEMTDASSDQEHLHIIVDNNTQVPDRTTAILYGGEDPKKEIIKSAKALEKIGAEVLIIACNTSHYFFEEIKSSVDTPMLSMIEETAKQVIRKGYKKVGLLATDGTCRAGVYGTVFEQMGIELIMPEGEKQQAVMDLIYKGVKAGKADYNCSDFENTIEYLLNQGAEAVILGCTELSTAFETYSMNYINVDPIKAISAAVIRYAGADVRNIYGY